jgi:hypothetical protein
VTDGSCSHPSPAPRRVSARSGVFIDFPVNNAFQKIVTSPPGSTILLLNGSLRISFTNVDTGKTITENVTGSGKAIVNPDGSLSIRQEGHLGLITLESADAERFALPPPGVIGGALFEEVAPDGTYTSVSMQVTSWWTSAPR